MKNKNAIVAILILTSVFTGGVLVGGLMTNDEGKLENKDFAQVDIGNELERVPEENYTPYTQEEFVEKGTATTEYLQNEYGEDIEFDVVGMVNPEDYFKYGFHPDTPAEITLVVDPETGHQYEVVYYPEIDTTVDNYDLQNVDASLNAMVNELAKTIWPDANVNARFTSDTINEQGLEQDDYKALIKENPIAKSVIEIETTSTPSTLEEDLKVFVDLLAAELNAFEVTLTQVDENGETINEVHASYFKDPATLEVDFGMYTAVPEK